MALEKDGFYYVVDNIQYYKESGSLLFEVLRYDIKEDTKKRNPKSAPFKTPYTWYFPRGADEKGNIIPSEFDEKFGADKLSPKGKNIINVIYEELKKRDKFFTKAKDV